MNNLLRELRFLVTQRCNYSCVFCHGEGLQGKKHEALKAKDYRFMFAVGKDFFNLKNTTLTGGEPLLRDDIVNIVDELYEESAKITLTTNGLLLNKNPDLGRLLEKVNLSLHCVEENKYESIVSKKGVFNTLVKNIYDFREKHESIKICINATIIDGINSKEEDFISLVEFARKINASIKYVELFPSSAKNFIPIKEIEIFLIKNKFHKIPSETRKSKFSDGITEVGLTKIFCEMAADQIAPKKYCHEHNDLFVSPDGKIKPCRNNLHEIDLMNAVIQKDSMLLAEKISQSFDMLGKYCIF
ncbi:MAG TPA: hypothetical protein DIC51_02450 [Coxiellaceae bacterium]|nr:hypothetical protein [Coxiellaceae bacterium]